MRRYKMFEEGKTYIATSICDSECIFEAKILKRSKNTLKIDIMDGVITKRVKKDFDGNEYFYMGSYSMAPRFISNQFKRGEK